MLRNLKEPLIWNEMKHFPVMVVSDYRHPFNCVKLQIFGFSLDDSEIANEIGSISFHLHDLVKATPIRSNFDIWNKSAHIGDMDLEMTFNYGALGYGYSSQVALFFQGFILEAPTRRCQGR